MRIVVEAVHLVILFAGLDDRAFIPSCDRSQSFQDQLQELLLEVSDSAQPFHYVPEVLVIYVYILLKGESGVVHHVLEPVLKEHLLLAVLVSRVEHVIP